MKSEQVLNATKLMRTTILQKLFRKFLNFAIFEKLVSATFNKIQRILMENSVEKTTINLISYFIISKAITEHVFRKKQNAQR